VITFTQSGGRIARRILCIIIMVRLAWRNDLLPAGGANSEVGEKIPL